MDKSEKERMIDWKVRDEIGFFTLSVPPENYLLKPEFFPLAELVTLIEQRPLRGIVISGTGRHFSAGADLNELKKLSNDPKALEMEMQRGNQLLSYIEELDIPVVAAINGVCFGGGLELALASHIRICNAKALFAFPETNHGLIPGLGGIARGFQITKPAGLLRMVLGGDIINADEAFEMHFVDHIVTNDPVEEAFLLLKKMTTDKPVEVIHAVMIALKQARRLPLNEALKEETRLFCQLATMEADRRTRS
jgi:enoyl-CoA hydratase/carnithine racemase